MRLVRFEGKDDGPFRSLVTWMVPSKPYRLTKACKSISPRNSDVPPGEAM